MWRVTRVRIPAWACEKVASDLELGGGFRRVLQLSFLHYLQLASHELAKIGINVTKNEIQIQMEGYSYADMESVWIVALTFTDWIYSAYLGARQGIPGC